MNYKKTWVLPIAGNGLRTQKLGIFKPFITIQDKYILEWFLISISDKIFFDDDFIFVTTDFYEENFLVQKTIKALFKKHEFNNTIKFKIVNNTPNGPAKSVESAIEYVDTGAPVIVINVDQFILFELPEKLAEKCYLVANIDIGDTKSYISLKEKKIIEIVEKNNFSNIASTGVYIFPDVLILKDCLKKLFEKKIQYKNEFYIADAMNLIINEIEFELIPSICKIDLGNIKSIEYFNTILKKLRNI